MKNDEILPNRYYEPQIRILKDDVKREFFREHEIQ